jgi:hypothetical protein
VGHLQPRLVDTFFPKKQQIDVDDPGALGPVCRPAPAEHALDAQTSVEQLTRGQ